MRVPLFLESWTGICTPNTNPCECECVCVCVHESKYDQNRFLSNQASLNIFSSPHLSNSSTAATIPCLVVVLLLFVASQYWLISRKVRKSRKLGTPAVPGAQRVVASTTIRPVHSAVMLITVNLIISVLAAGSIVCFDKVCSIEHTIFFCCFAPFFSDLEFFSISKNLSSFTTHRIRPKIPS